MMPAACSQSLPFGKDLNPFDIFFLMPRKDILRFQVTINRFNEDTSLTAGVFTFRTYSRELIEQDESGEKVLQLLYNSDIIARIIHPNDEMVHVEHSHIGLDWRTEEQSKEEIRLFLHQVCRANLDEVRQELLYPSAPYLDEEEDENYRERLREFESLFMKLSRFYATKADSFSLKRLRPMEHKLPYKPPRKSPSGIYNDQTMGFPGFLSFEVAAAFSGYETKKTKKKFIDKLNITQNQDGSFKLDADTLKKILLEGKFIQPKEEISDLKLYVFNNPNVNFKADRFPILRIEIGDQNIEIPFKNHQGTILYIATLLKQHFGQPLKREEIINIFKNIDSDAYPPINSDNLEESVNDSDIPAYAWLREIYLHIFEEETKSDNNLPKDYFFNRWCYKMYINGSDDPFKIGLNQLKHHIKACMEEAGFGIYAPFILIESYVDGRSKEYSLKLIGENIFFKDKLSQLLQATENYINHAKKQRNKKSN